MREKLPKSNNVVTACAIASLPSWLAFKVKETLGKLEENYVSDWKFPQF